MSIPKWYWSWEHNIKHLATMPIIIPKPFHKVELIMGASYTRIGYSCFPNNLSTSQHFQTWLNISTKMVLMSRKHTWKNIYHSYSFLHNITKKEKIIRVQLYKARAHTCILIKWIQNNIGENTNISVPKWYWCYQNSNPNALVKNTKILS